APPTSEVVVSRIGRQAAGDATRASTDPTRTDQLRQLLGSIGGFSDEISRQWSVRRGPTIAIQLDAVAFVQALLPGYYP
ncbi:unnamed protein product, partial [Scytosiphon promiscuus]